MALRWHALCTGSFVVLCDKVHPAGTDRVNIKLKQLQQTQPNSNQTTYKEDGVDKLTSTHTNDFNCAGRLDVS